MLVSLFSCSPMLGEPDQPCPFHDLYQYVPCLFVLEWEVHHPQCWLLAGLCLEGNETMLSHGSNTLAARFHGLHRRDGNHLIPSPLSPLLSSPVQFNGGQVCQ